MNELAIDTKDLTKTYGSIRAVGGINLSVPRGAIYGFLGRNGAGKTTTIKMLLGLTRPTTGAARVFGMNVSAGRISIRQRTAFVSEKKILYPWLTPTGISEEFANKTAGFLLTKPRSIRWFVWTGWAANALQFLTLTGTMVLVGASILSWRCHVPITWRLLLTFVPGLIMTFLMFGMTYLLGVLHQNGRNGFISSLGVVIVFPIICLAAEYFWHIHVPSPGDMYPFEMGEIVRHPEVVATLPPLWPLVGWSLVALSCPLVAELVLEHTELCC